MFNDGPPDDDLPPIQKLAGGKLRAGRLVHRCARCQTTLGLAQVPDGEWLCAPCACNDVSNLRRYRKDVETMDIINRLREEEGSSVTIVSDNADFNGKPNCMIYANGPQTKWVETEYPGETILACLQAALKDKTDHAAKGS